MPVHAISFSLSIPIFTALQKIKPFKGDPQDTGLLELLPFLHSIVASGVSDVREVINSYGDAEVSGLK